MKWILGHSILSEHTGLRTWGPPGSKSLFLTTCLLHFKLEAASVTVVKRVSITKQSCVLLVGAQSRTTGGFLEVF